MSLSIDWEIRIGNTTTTDFSSRVLGLSINQQLQWMRPALQTCTLTLQNYDGALTPDEIGGNGTYKTTNWFRQVVFVKCKVTKSTGVTTSYDVFNGFIDQFDLDDNGRYSTVTVAAVDWLTVASRSEAISSLGTGDRTINYVMKSYITRLDVEADLPYFGIYPPVTSYNELTSDFADSRAGITLNDSFLTATGSVGDQLANQIMTSGLSLTWATNMYYSAGPNAVYNCLLVGNSLNRAAPGPADYPPLTFDITAGTTAANKLDLVDVTYGFAIDSLANQAKISNGTNTANVKNTTSINSYGNAMFEATDTLNASLASATAQAQAVSQRFGFLYYRPISVELSSANLRNSHDDSTDDFGNLVSWNGLWQELDLTVTPTGGTSKLTRHMIFGRTINATPADTRVTLNLVGRYQFQSFRLNYSTLDFERLA